MGRFSSLPRFLPLFPFLLGFPACESPSTESAAAPLLEVSEFTILTSDSVVSDVRDAIPGPDGGIWVLSSFEPHVVWIDSTTSRPVRFGRSGAGPEELQNPWYLAAHPLGVGVYDAGARRMKVYSQAGDFVEEMRTPDPGGFVLNEFRESNHGEPLRVHRVGGGWVFETYSGQVAHSGALWSGRLLFLSDAASTSDGASTPDTLIQYDSLRSFPLPEGPQVFATAPLWTVCGGEAVAVLNPLDSLVIRIDPRGETRKTRIPLPRNPLAQETVEPWVDRRLDLAMGQENVTMSPSDREAAREQALAQVREMVPEHEPPTKILCDGAGRYWVQGFSVETDLQGYGRDWTVFRDEARVASVRLPPRVFPVFIRASSIVAVWRDEMDVERLVELENPLAGSASQ